MTSFMKSTGIVAASTFLSRILGLVRDILFAGFFGASGNTDVFLVAFRIPNLLRRFVAEGTLTISFIPVYTDYLVKQGEKEALALAQKTFSILVMVVIFLITAGIVFSPEIISVIAPGFTDPDKIYLAVSLNRIMFPYLFFVTFVAFSMGILNSHGYFFAPSFSPVLFNVGYISGIVGFSLYFDEPFYGVAAGILAGGLFQLLLQIPYLIKSGFKLKISIDFNHPGVRRIFKLVLPALFAGGIYQINIVMSTLLASMLKDGSISYLYYSDRLNELVLGIFIVSIGNVILPAMSRMTAVDDYDKLKELYSSAMSASLFLAVPACIALMIVGFPVISVFFMRGAFTAVEADMTYRALFFASLGISSVSILRITTPTFYSLEDSKTPIYAAAVGFVLNISLGYLLMQTELKHAGLTLGNSIAATVQMLLLLFLLRNKIGKIGLKNTLLSLGKFITAGAVMGVSIFYLAGLVDWVNDGLSRRLLFLAVIVLSGGSIYFLCCWFLRVDEMRFLVNKIKSKIVRK
ncbi:MAG: murein biosynthesis integral membrane protein MurJ [bacterium]|nr:murein biosynthesis integral membrane protein MurJ [bacterium]